MQKHGGRYPHLKGYLEQTYVAELWEKKAFKKMLLCAMNSSLK